MFNLAIILLSLMNSESADSNNNRIAKYILEHIDELENVSISDLARKCYVSNSSISRFCRAIGLQDYNELRNQVAKYQVEHPYTVAHKFRYPGEDADEPYSAYVDQIIANLTSMKNSVDSKEIDALISDIFRYEKVSAFGYLQSENVALNLQYDLQTSRKIIFTCMQFADQIEHIRNADEKELIIVFSESGTYFRRAFAHRNVFTSPRNKPMIYVITSNQKINQPYVDHYIRYVSDGNYASHPYPLNAIAGMIASGFARRKQVMLDEE